MTASVVQTFPKNTGVPSTVTTSTAGVLPTTGDAVIFAVHCDGAAAGSSVTSVTDNQTGSPNTYTQRVVGSNVSNSNVLIYSCDNITVNLGTFVVTVTFANNCFNVIGGIQVTGLSATPFDQSGSNSSGSNQTGGSATASGANSQANTLVVANVYDSVNSTNAGIGTPAGYTAIVTEQDGTNVGACQAIYKFVTAGETSSATWSWSGGAAKWAAAIATWKSTAPGSPPPFLLRVWPVNVLLRR